MKGATSRHVEKLRIGAESLVLSRLLYFAMFVPIQSGGQLCESAYCSHVGVCVILLFTFSRLRPRGGQTV